MKMPELHSSYQRTETIMINKQNMDYALAGLPTTSSVISLNQPCAEQPGWLTRFGCRLARFPATLEVWRLRHKTRIHLARADMVMLRDVGISQSQRFIEANKPFWQA